MSLHMSAVLSAALRLRSCRRSEGRGDTPTLSSVSVRHWLCPCSRRQPRFHGRPGPAQVSPPGLRTSTRSQENLGSDQRLTCGSLYSIVQPSEQRSEDDSLQQHPSTWGVSGGVCRVTTRQHAVTFRTSTKHRDDPVGFLQGPGLGRRWGPSSVTPL